VRSPSIRSFVAGASHRACRASASARASGAPWDPRPVRFSCPHSIRCRSFRVPVCRLIRIRANAGPGHALKHAAGVIQRADHGAVPGSLYEAARGFQLGPHRARVERELAGDSRRGRSQSLARQSPFDPPSTGSTARRTATASSPPRRVPRPDRLAPSTTWFALLNSSQRSRFRSGGGAVISRSSAGACR